MKKKYTSPKAEELEFSLKDIMTDDDVVSGSTCTGFTDTPGYYNIEEEEDVVEGDPNDE